MPPYSSATIARWNLPACISRIRRLDRLVLRDEPHRPDEVQGRRVAAPLALGTHEVLGVDDADDVLVVVAVQWQTAVSVRDGEIEPSRNCRVVGHDDHVRSRHHHLASDGVAELDDALDELALLVFDDLVLGGRLDDAEQLLLADERALLQALAGQ